MNCKPLLNLVKALAIEGNRKKQHHNRVAPYSNHCFHDLVLDLTGAS